MFDQLPFSVLDATDRGPASHVLLIVEDEPSIRRAFVDAFTRVGFEVLEAADVAAALVLWRKHRDRISLVVSDVDVPGPAVEYLVAAARSRNPAPPVVLVSGELLGGAARVREMDLKRSVNSYLAKPLAVESLRLEVERHLAVLP